MRERMPQGTDASDELRRTRLELNRTKQEWGSTAAELDRCKRELDNLKSRKGELDEARRRLGAMEEILKRLTEDGDLFATRPDWDSFSLDPAVTGELKRCERTLDKLREAVDAYVGLQGRRD